MVGFLTSSNYLDSATLLIRKLDIGNDDAIVTGIARELYGNKNFHIVLFIQPDLYYAKVALGDNFQ